MYKLMIKKRNSKEWQVADFGKDTPSMTFTIHDISAFDKRQSNYSQRLKLPLTDNNKRIFDFITAPNYNGTIQKDYLDARLFVNGQTLLGAGGVLSVVGVNDSAIEVCLLSSAKDFFTKLEAIDFDNTDIFGTPRLPATDFSQGVEQVTDETDFVFASYANSVGVYHSNNTDKDDKGYIRYGLPMLRVCHNYEGGASGLLPRLCSSLGYSFQSDIDFTDLCLSLCDRKANSGINGTIPKELLSINGNGNIVDKTLKITELPETKYYFIFEAEVEATNANPRYLYMRFDLYPDAAYPDYDDIVNGYFYSSDKGFSNWQKSENGKYIKKFVYLPEETKTYYTNENGEWVYDKTHYNVGVVNPNNVRVVLNLSHSDDFSGKASIRSSIIYAAATDGVAVTGTHINVAKSLGWKNGRDAMNSLCNIFGAIVRVDETTKTFYFNSLSTIIKNKAKAKDWSDKLLKGVAQTFVIGQFAQRSTIALEQNGVTNYLSKADIRIDNKTISDQKEVLKVPLESPFSNRILQYNNGEFVVAKAPTMAKVDQSLETPKVTKCYEANDILSLYKGYETMLNNGFIIDVELMLTDLDVSTLDFFAPVYLRQYGRFFYINEIKNFVSGKPTEATLIAI
jgi:hypothetical protein